MVIGASAGIPVVGWIVATVAAFNWALIDSYYRRGYCLGIWASSTRPKTPHPYPCRKRVLLCS